MAGFPDEGPFVLRESARLEGVGFVTIHIPPFSRKRLLVEKRLPQEKRPATGEEAPGRRDSEEKDPLNCHYGTSSPRSATVRKKAQPARCHRLQLFGGQLGAHA